MPIPTKKTTGTKAQLQERITELESTIERQDNEWNELVEEFENYKKNNSTGATETDDKQIQELQAKVEELDRLMKEADEKHKEELKEKNQLIKGYKGNLSRAEKKIAELEQKKETKEITDTTELESINTQLIADKKDLIDKVDQLTQRNKQLELSNTQHIPVNVNDIVVEMNEVDTPETVESLAYKLTNRGMPVYTNVGNRTFLSIADATKYANLKRDDSIRNVLRGKQSKAGYIEVQGEQIPIDHWRYATKEEIEKRRSEIAIAILTKIKE